MKNIKLIIATALLIPLSLSIYAAGDHKHHGKEKAPHKGRLMETDKMHVEFVVEADKIAKVYLYDDHLKPIAPSDQKLTLIVQEKDGSKNKIELIKKDDAFASPSPITTPEGAKAVLTIKAGEKTNNLRFDLNMTVCNECKNSEYACSCGH